MKTLNESRKQARVLLKNRLACDNLKPWKGLYIVRCNDDSCYRIGSHYHTATLNDIEDDNNVVDYVSL
jgi:hypothetical protein